MLILHKKTDKKYIQTLPISQFKGRIITIFTPGEVETAVNYLLT
ncbi:MAG: 3'-5' exonuclease domain-containing protein 2, partial [Bacteroidaceae bacterium]|nr:3'-5' exonuclease domain-containing protein 2 [Bacteroidaceae bacterium]